MVKSEFQNIVLSISLFLLYVIQAIALSKFNLVYLNILWITLSVIGTTILCHFLFNRNSVNKRLKGITDIIHLSLIMVLIFPVKANLLSVIITVFFTLFISFLIFRKLTYYSFHPVLLGWLFYNLLFPEQFTQKDAALSINPWFLIEQTGGSIVDQMVIGFLIVAVISIIFRRINLFTALSFLLSFLGLILLFMFLDTSSIIFSGSFLVCGLFILSDSILAPSYKLASVLSGIISSVLAFLLHYIINIESAFMISFIITHFINPYLDRLVVYLKNVKFA